jgi:LacI family transcriptional regulator
LVTTEDESKEIEPLLASFRANADAIRRWELFGLRLRLPEAFAFEELKPLPANVKVVFETRKNLRLTARRIDGAIIATATRRDALIAQCLKLGLPAVLVNRAADGSRVSAVVNDDRAGIALAVAHLAALGHRAIGHVAGPGNISTGQARRAGFLAAVKAHGLAAAPVAVADSYSVAAGERACAQLLGMGRSISAVVAANDLLALGCYDELRRRGLACPQALSITGFNDMAFADRFDPPLTSVRIQHRVMGVEAARLLLAQIDNPRAAAQEIRLQPDLVTRGSSAAPPLGRKRTG